jgi:molybdopterin-guanine dinucleotide biosynthesis adapter protein
MAMGFPVILQVIGFQNSGKTTVITKLLERLSAEGIKTGVLKHHGHGNALEVHDNEKDTGQHRSAGACVTGVTSSVNSIFAFNEAVPLEKGIEMFKVIDVECILIEGYKKIQHPRVVLCRDEKDMTLLESSKDPIAIISHSKITGYREGPVHLLEDDKTWLPILMEFVTNQVDRGRTVGNETF